MKARELAVEGAFAFTPEVFHDDRGMFLSPHQEEAFTQALGRPLFPVAQCSYSVSRRGVVRGVHYTATPPGMAKYAYCTRGAALDVVVDTRVGSPTFGTWDSVVLDTRECQAVLLPTGVGHLFVALEDDTAVSYLLSTAYAAEREHALSPLDPALGLPIPDDITPVLSERDRAAPTLAEAERAGLLPRYADCRALDLSGARP
ncbi:dTDP-4-dehydrorhamnose 3,5-epimerase family protein [Streptomyces ficellus]|uniref:dTDP-4-keto-6-deoxy-D-glucose epimerase n=1 Tax=Streptomyces ficellus TaxID=1977088 RepID=A0A6I6FG88_9ACTN|nr:dTDP-4-dehydrorhamnose 3,5-epimerase family protein [Streptomyces ficellus]QGV77509.1 dTDP-4-keto-6-deoxy-D-glucose epimerase [Streptomyces ficellus]